MRNILILTALMAGSPLVAQAMDPNMKMDPAMKMAPNMKMGDGMAGMDHMAMMKNTPANPYAEASMMMQHRMMMATGGDASETFTRKMIEHHRGAIAMSKIAVAKTQDKETREIAQRYVMMQEKDIAELEAWLSKHGKSAQ